jgi:MFS family permease
MDRSMWAVLGGTFTLRFSTGLTGAMLGAYLAHLPQHGGPHVGPVTLGLLASAFFVSELLLSTVFGVLSDRLGHHRVMLFGPVFGAVAVVLTGLTTNIPLLAGTRLLEGASTAASVPSILGYIAVATASSEILRGKAAARFEGATLAGIGTGIVVGVLLFAALGPTAFYHNALVYGLSFLIYRFGVEDRDADARAAAHAAQSGEGSRRIDWTRYRTLLRSSHIWLLAPTWIAVNASIGLWFSQSIFQLSKSDPRFPNQVLLRGFSPTEIAMAAVVIGVLFGTGLLYWGNRFKSLRRTTIILYGIGGGAVLVVGGLAINHGEGQPIVVPLAGALAAAFGLFVLAGATPAALGLLADISEKFPADRGAIMGLYSVFLAVGQIVGSLIGGLAAEMSGIDGLLIATIGFLLVALGPLALLRRQEHYVRGPSGPAVFDEIEPHVGQ